MPLYQPPVYKVAPSYMIFGGHSFFNQAGNVPDQSYRLDQAALGLMGIPREASTTRAMTGADLLSDAQGKYGYTTFLQNSKRSNTGFPYVGNSGAYCFCYGINDMGHKIPSSDYPAATIQAQVKTALQHAWRTLISRSRASVIYECGGTDESGQWAFGAGFTNQSGVNVYNSGNGYRQAATTTAATATFTIPADFPGGTIAIGCVGAYGAAGQAGAGGTMTITGTFSGTGGASIVTTNFMPVGSTTRAHYLRRFTNLPASDASKTIILTATVVDASGFVGIDYAQIEATTDIPLVVMCNISRLLNTTAYVNNWSGSYWTNASNLGATGDADVAAFNVALASVVAEFDQYVVIADVDKALAKSSNFINPVDGIHPNQAGCLVGGQAIWNAIVTAPTSYNNLVPDWRIKGGERFPRASQYWYGPEVYGMTSTTVTMVTGTMYLYPIVVSEDNEVWDRVSFEVTTAATGNAATVYLGIYNDEGWSGRPQELNNGTGSQAITTTGVKTATINWALDPGLYWLAFDLELQGSTIAGAVRGFTGQMPKMPQSTSGASPTIGTWIGNTAYQVTGVNTGFGFLPGDLGFSQPIVATAAPLMLIRRK